MANKSLFKTLAGKLLPVADTKNSERAPAYAFAPKHALAQYAATGCMNQTFYATADEQLETVLKLALAVEPEFVARTALYARSKGAMKDMPALLCAVLAARSPGLLAEVFDRLIDSPKMLRNFVQIVRSGVTGRKSLGSLPKRLVIRWLESRTDEQLFTGSVGNDPSLADIIKMVHPKPHYPSREALFGYLIGREHNAAHLPEVVREFEAFKRAPKGEVPDVPFQMLTALPLPKDAWKAIARNSSWQSTRMNLNTFKRHGVFEDASMVDLIAAKLSDAALIKKARAFPYQLLAAFQAATDVPRAISEALQSAMEVATENVPALNGRVFVFPDVSGSMRTSVTGVRKGATSAVRCVDVAALITATIVRRNPQAEVIPFESQVVSLKLNPRDSVMTNAEKLGSIGGGGTNCSAPLQQMLDHGDRVDVAIYVSDNESWVDAAQRGQATQTMVLWEKLKKRNPQAKLICIDLVPNKTTQASERADILNVGGFSDAVFDVMARFAEGTLDPGHWVGVIEAERI